jgi:hypothetical protein
MASDNQFPIGQRINLAGHFPEPVILEAVRAERLNEALSSAFGGVAVYADETAESPHRLHFFELSIAAQIQRVISKRCTVRWLSSVSNSMRRLLALRCLESTGESRLRAAQNPQSSETP